MARSGKRMHQVRQPKKKLNDQGNIPVGVITSDQLRQARRGAQRQALKEAGMLGVHGTRALEPSKREISRRNRQDWKKRVKDGNEG